MEQDLQKTPLQCLPGCDAILSTINFTDVSEKLTTTIFRFKE
jgi:hypothetical protein